MYRSFFTLALTIIMYFCFIYVLSGGNPVYYDLLNRQIVGGCSLWPITHVIAYGLITYMHPDRWFEIFIIGCLWEIFEYFMFTFFSGKIHGKNYYSLTRSSDNKLQYDTVWWSASSKDIIFNTIGISSALLILN